MAQSQSVPCSFLTADLNTKSIHLCKIQQFTETVPTGKDIWVVFVVYIVCPVKAQPTRLPTEVQSPTLELTISRERYFFLHFLHMEFKIEKLPDCYVH